MLPISLGLRKRQDSWREDHHFQQVKHPTGRVCKCGKGWQADSGRCSGEGAAAAPHPETGSRRRACHHFIGILDQDVEQNDNHDTRMRPHARKTIPRARMNMGVRGMLTIAKRTDLELLPF